MAARVAPKAASSALHHAPCNSKGDPESFLVTYEIYAPTEEAARRQAETVALEQSIEAPASLVQGTPLEREVLATVVSVKLSGASDGTWTATIRYPAADVGGELPQFLNLVYGLGCLHAQVSLVDFTLSPTLQQHFAGPRFGVEGLRKLCRSESGPLLCAVLKPLGRTVEELAACAYAFAKGGLDVIKDDDSLQNQCWAPFEERVSAVAAAVRKANEETGRNCLYAACLNSPVTLFMQRAKFAKEAGAGAALVLPGVTGFDSIRALAADDSFGLPIISHPSFMGMTGGSTTPGTRSHGLAHRVEFGLLPRMAGADVSIYPNAGGAFDISGEECLSIRQAAAMEGFGACRPMFPSPSGGTKIESAEQLCAAYGDTVFLVMGTSLYTAGPCLEENARTMASRLHRSHVSTQ